ncbi:20332_t:CDS:2 [Dentiscutata erythropus]|uniref:20332_t:CDS:1 n=1 Tax=Dentiscutata erythropus TaxID=1348616 RepID=A0A9N9NKZ8_9GLOM|nr:20332_t:CDS:2 [Dentiscutata erythropus]
MSQSSPAKQELKVKELPYIFIDLVSKYNDLGLSVCGMSRLGHWKKANGPAATKKLNAFQDFIPELRDREFSQFSICVNYYNQTIVNNLFYQHLLDISSAGERFWLDISPNNVEIVADDVSLHLLEFEKIVENNNFIITKLQRQVENKNRVISKLNIQLEECHNVMAQFEELYQEQFEAYQERISISKPL